MVLLSYKNTSFAKSNRGIANGTTYRVRDEGDVEVAALKQLLQEPGIAAAVVSCSPADGIYVVENDNVEFSDIVDVFDNCDRLAGQQSVPAESAHTREQQK